MRRDECWRGLGTRCQWCNFFVCSQLWRGAAAAFGVPARWAGPSGCALMVGSVRTDMWPSTQMWPMPKCGRTLSQGPSRKEEIPGIATFATTSTTAANSMNLGRDISCVRLPAAAAAARVRRGCGRWRRTPSQPQQPPRLRLPAIQAGRAQSFSGSFFLLLLLHCR